MHSNGYERDIIIVTGCNAVGKTTASNYLRKLANLHKILFENCIISDSQCLFEAMQLDDQAGGLHHTHDWCTTGTQDHSHLPDRPEFPFIVLDDELPNMMRQQFFLKLTELPNTGKLWFVEWAAGINTNPPEDPVSCIDYSYSLVKRMFHDGTLPDGWLKRIKAAIHLEADNHVRFELNKKRFVPSSARMHAIETGTAFWQKDERVLRFYGRDDFSEIKGLFQAAGIPIYTLKNDGGNSFYKGLAKIAGAIFLPRLPLFFSSMVMYISSMFSLFGHHKSTSSTEKPLMIKETSPTEEQEKVSV